MIRINICRAVWPTEICPTLSQTPPSPVEHPSGQRLFEKSRACCLIIVGGIVVGSLYKISLPLALAPAISLGEKCIVSMSASRCVYILWPRSYSRGVRFLEQGNPCRNSAPGRS